MDFLTRQYSQIKNIIQQLGRASTIPQDERFSRCPLAFYKTPTGNYYLPANTKNDCVAVDIRAGRIFEPEVVEAARQHIKKGTTVLDIGANFGQMSLLFSRFVGEEGQVLSFEADDFVFYILQKNIQANHRDNIRAFLGAVYNQSGKTVHYPVPDFKRFAAYGAYGLNPRATTGRTIETLAIDDLHIRTPISFLKVDVQGSDLFAMQGSVETIRRHQMPIIFEFEEQFQDEFQTAFQDYLDFIDSIRYKIEKTIYKINYLIVPNKQKIFGTTEAPSPAPDTEPTTGPMQAAEPAAPMSLLNPPKLHLCEFLKSRADVESCTSFLYRNGFVSHNIKCKDWDLAHIIPHIKDGNFLDMGSSDSYILKNLALKKIHGEMHGIDLRKPDVPLPSVKYHIGDLMKTGLPDKFFRNIACLSVIEHQVDFAIFAQEVSRLLENNGKLFVTFDYWDPKIIPPVKLYQLKWQPLDKQAVEALIAECERHVLHLLVPVDWSIKEAVIRHGYYSPHPDISYTFGILVFEKRA